MAKLFFYYASMNAGKSTNLLQADFNYRERGMATMLWTAAFDNRTLGQGPSAQEDVPSISSRVGLNAMARGFTAGTDLRAEVLARHAEMPLACVLVDEAQFLSHAQVWQLADIVDRAGIPVLCYGLRTDFRGDLFEGSAALLGLADELVEVKAVCHCGRKATMNVRLDADGSPLHTGAQTEVGGNERYLTLCRAHFSEALRPGVPDV
ncbi:thymidine kinase [Novosphingobium sp.]|uniref:thymidine kinase n=1 Tax=Novosphingobium sp. TaxID=1874826 RepID=UPI0038BD5DCF